MLPTRRQATGRTVARSNGHPRLRLSAAPLRQHPHASIRRATAAGRSQNLRSASLQFVRRLWLRAS